MRNFKYMMSALFLIVGISCSEQAKVEPTTETTPQSNTRQFEKISSQQTGIDFKNTLLETFEYNYYKFQYLYNGGGVAVGDINNDGLPDVYFSATMYSNQLYLNKGDFKFENITEKADVYAGGGTKTGVTMVDINNDGFLDIYVCRTGKETQKETRSNLFYINNGDLSFTERSKEMGLEEYCFSNHATFFDYDNDGDLDMYLMNHPTDFKKESRPNVKLVNGVYQRMTTPDNEYESDRLYRNNGNGTFSDVSKQAGVVNRAFGLSVSITDINQDGWMDVFVANDYDEPDIVYINQKNGTFKDLSDGIFKHTSQNSMGSDFGDINNDGLQDLMVVDMLPEDNRRQKTMMTKMTDDRVALYAKRGFGYQYMRNVLQLNNGDGTYSDIGNLAGVSATDWSWAPLMADYDNDGWKDIFITNGIRRDFTNMDYLKFTKSQFGNVTNAQSIYEFLDKMPTEKLHNYMYQNKGDLTFNDRSYSWGFSEATYSNGAAYADLDADGDLDLVINNIDTPASIYRNEGNGKNNYLQIKLEGSATNNKGIGASVQIRTKAGVQYQEMTPTHGYFSSLPYVLHFGLGDVSSVDELIVRWQDGKEQRLNELTANQVLTLKYADALVDNADKKVVSNLFEPVNLGIDFRHIENNFVDFKREPLMPHQLSKEGPALTVGDVNGDGLEDFYVGGGAGQLGALYLQNTQSKFEKAPIQPWTKASEDVDALFFDADGDKDLDLYVVSGGNAYPENQAIYQDRLYLNDGQGSFSKSDNLPTTTSSGGTVAAGDYDGDGDLDLFVGGRVTPEKYPFTPKSYLLQNDGGKFTDVTTQANATLSKIGMVTDAKWTDIDGDKQVDLVICGEWMPMTIFKNEGGKLTNITAKVGLGKTNGWWQSIELKDMDGDGDIDIIGGNAGLNTRFKANVSQPLAIYAADFDNNGAIDPIMTHYIKGISYPVAQKDLLLGQLKSLQKKYLYYDAYAKATINDLIPNEKFESALKLEVYTLGNNYFENQNGQFTQRQLPMEGQFLPGRSVITNDFDKDGKQDILIIGNNYNTEVESGRQDVGTGVLLIANGKGSFQKSRTTIGSGLLNHEDARKMRTLKLSNGQNCIVIANNQGEINSFIWKDILQ